MIFKVGAVQKTKFGRSGRPPRAGRCELLGGQARGGSARGVVNRSGMQGGRQLGAPGKLALPRASQGQGGRWWALQLTLHGEV